MNHKWIKIISIMDGCILLTKIHLALDRFVLVPRRLDAVTFDRNQFLWRWIWNFSVVWPHERDTFVANAQLWLGWNDESQMLQLCRFPFLSNNLKIKQFERSNLCNPQRTSVNLIQSTPPGCLWMKSVKSYSVSCTRQSPSALSSFCLLWSHLKSNHNFVNNHFSQ